MHDVSNVSSGDDFIRDAQINHSTSSGVTEVFLVKDGQELASGWPEFRRPVSIFALTCVTLSMKKSHKSVAKMLMSSLSNLVPPEDRCSRCITVFYSRHILSLTLVTCSRMKKEHHLGFVCLSFSMQLGRLSFQPSLFHPGCTCFGWYPIVVLYTLTSSSRMQWRETIDDGW